MNTYTPSEVIYDELSGKEALILTDLDLNPTEHSIGGMHLSKNHEMVELDIYNKAGRYVTDAYLRVSDVLGDVQ